MHAPAHAQVLTADPKILMQRFLAECRAVGVQDVAGLQRIALQTIGHLKGTDAERSITVLEEELQQRWYASLKGGQPDWSVYATDYYLGELWACWMVYSRKYLKEICKPGSLPPAGILHALGSVRKVVDLGCGFGITTACLRQMFPGAQVIGTNLTGTTQTAIALRWGRQFGFGVTESVAHIEGPVDLVFASEYFEHIPAPISHLDEVLDALEPRALLIANTFGTRSIGHFDHYQIEGQPVHGSLCSRLFNERLRQRGYHKVPTKMWNQRPAFWMN